MHMYIYIYLDFLSDKLITLIIRVSGLIFFFLSFLRVSPIHCTDLSSRALSSFVLTLNLDRLQFWTCRMVIRFDSFSTQLHKGCFSFCMTRKINRNINITLMTPILTLKTFLCWLVRPPIGNVRTDFFNLTEKRLPYWHIYLFEISEITFSQSWLFVEVTYWRPMFCLYIFRHRKDMWLLLCGFFLLSLR